MVQTRSSSDRLGQYTQRFFDKLRLLFNRRTALLAPAYLQRVLDHQAAAFIAAGDEGRERTLDGTGIAQHIAQHQRILDHARQVIAERTPEVAVELSDVAFARDARRLVEASEGTRALVVAARGEGLTSASSETGAVVQLAHTPIWVERPDRRS